MQKFLFFLSVILLLLFAGCAPKPIPPIAVAAGPKPVQYLRDVQPILDRRCTVCHSCYNAPCQLKLSAFEGLERGGTKAAVYDAERLSAADPTRLFIDADSAQAWHKKYGFYSVTKNGAGKGFNDSLLITLLDAKRQRPRSRGVYRPEYDELTCPRDHGELESFLDDYPERGMPYGFPAMSETEFGIIAQWLQQGAKGPTLSEQKALHTPSPTAQRQIDLWEAFLNRADAKHAVTARYLYEHFFLAHIRFGGTGGEYYELVRSYTPAPEAVVIVPTVRPYDSPGKRAFYYRFRKITSTIVHKTHMVVTFDDHELKRLEHTFIDTAWDESPHRMDYDPERSANPFATYRQIPPSVRYGFLLDHSEYIIRTFIRGPVCKGQVALNVINDHFWVMFLDPEYDLSLRYPNLLNFNAGALALPTERGSDFPARRLFSDRYIDRAIEYYKERGRFYGMVYTKGLGYDAIWKGAEADDAPLLTVYRHFDSASVHRGALGDLPKTLWVIDYPLFERIYYALVAGFDVFGNIGHQTNVRRYMDRLRVEGETNFIDFMPKKVRSGMFDAWNKNLSRLVENKLYYRASPMPAAVAYATITPKREFVEHIVDEHLRRDVGIAFDPVNYFREGQAHPPLPEHYRTRDDYIQAFRAIAAPGTAFIRAANGQQSNLAYVRVRMENGKPDVIFSIVINRWHDNVAFMFDEKERLDPSKDEADYIFDFIGSYPNILVDLSLDEAPAFFKMMHDFKDTPKYRRQFFHFAVTRDDPKFWETYDWFQREFYKMHPVEAGLFDLNRYYSVALPDDYDGDVPGQ